MKPARRVFGRALVAFAASLGLVALAACSTTAQLAGAPADGTAVGEAAALPGQYGSGSRIVGVLAFAEPNNLSDGSADSVALAAQLAATTLNGNPLTVIVRTALPDASNAGTLVNELEAAGVSMIIGSDSERVAVAVAQAISPRGVPTISLTSFSDLAIQLYGGAYVLNEEAVTLVNEAAKRGYSSLAVVTTPGKSSEDFTKSVLSLATAAGITARPVDGSTDSQFLAGMTAMAAAGVPVSAIVFGTGPTRAAAMMAQLQSDARFKSVALIGNSGWKLGGKLPAALKGAWYPSISSDGLAGFADKFRAANGAAPTLNAAMIYDLLVLAAALPQTVGDQEPYHPEVMTNPQGFRGFTGQFRFGATGMLSARNYVIETVN